MILLRGVLVTAAREIEAQPALNLVGLRSILCAVVVVHFNHTALLGVVGSSLVVQDSIPEQTDPVLLCNLAELEQLFFRTPLGAPSTLLVELAKVVEVVDVVAVAFR